MKSTDKLKLVDMITSYLSQFEEASKDSPKMVGTLATPQGIKGFKTADVGTPVFDVGDRYMIILETLDGKSSHEVKYYKESLASVINFEGAI